MSSSPSRHAPADPPDVHLYVPGSAAPPARPLTLKQFFHAWFIPRYLRPGGSTKKQTLAEYRSIVNLWAELTGDPPLAKIRSRTLSEFVEADLLRPGKEPDATISPNTVRKHCTHLQMVLNLAGPRCRDYPDAAKLYGLFGSDRYGRPRQPPLFRKPPERDKLPTDAFTLDEVCQWLAVCDQATRPRVSSCRPPAWWRSLILFLYNSGVRIGAAIALRREWIHEHEAGWGWLELPPEAQKGSRPALVYLSPFALEALKAIPTVGLVYPWPHTAKHLHHVRRQMLAEAGIDKGRRWGFHGLRKNLGSILWSKDPKLARMQLGHADEKTTLRHYASPSAQVLGLAASLGPVIDAIPQPAPKAQRLLF